MFTRQLAVATLRTRIGKLANLVLHFDIISTGSHQSRGHRLLVSQAYHFSWWCYAPWFGYVEHVSPHFSFTSCSFRRSFFTSCSGHEFILALESNGVDLGTNLLYSLIISTCIYIKKIHRYSCNKEFDIVYKFRNTVVLRNSCIIKHNSPPPSGHPKADYSTNPFNIISSCPVLSCPISSIFPIPSYPHRDAILTSRTVLLPVRDCV